MFNKPEEYVFEKINEKVKSVQSDLANASEVCEFARKQEFSKDTISAIKRDLAKRLKKAEEQLNEAIMFANCQTGQEDDA